VVRPQAGHLNIWKLLFGQDEQMDHTSLSPFCERMKWEKRIAISATPLARRCRRFLLALFGLTRYLDKLNTLFRLM